jgi:tripartite-type tricarboxylate transporter receptor subunit TctC
MGGYSIMKCNMKTAVGLGFALAISTSISATALAQAAYPTQAVKFVVGNVAGSSSDTIARVLTTSLTQILGQQALVINQPGAGGTIAAEAVARAAPDGYTIKVTSTQAHAISPHLYPKAKYKPLEDFVPITMVARTENILVVPPQQPFKTVKDIIDFAKQNPGKLTMANAGPGSQSHLAGAMFASMAGIDVLHVPYKGAASVTAVVGNQNELTLTPMPATASHVSSGRLRAIAIGGTARSSVLPDVPTIAESGLKDFNSSGWTGLVAPKGTPSAVVDKLREAVIKAAADPTTAQAMLRAGGEPWTTTPQEMWKFVAEDIKRYEHAVKVSGAKVE